MAFAINDRVTIAKLGGVKGEIVGTKESGGFTAYLVRVLGPDDAPVLRVVNADNTPPLSQDEAEVRDWWTAEDLQAAG